MKALTIALGCLGFLALAAIHLLLIPFLIMLVLQLFGIDLTFWQTVGAWWLTSLVAGLLTGGVKRGN